MKKLYVVIGRFQPFHLGHQSMIDKAIQLAEETNGEVLVLVGSSNKAPSLNNPLTYLERATILSNHYDNCPYFNVAPLRDYDYNNGRWEDNLHNVIYQACGMIFPDEKVSINLVCGNKDNDVGLRESWVEDDWGVIGFKPSTLGGSVLSATSIREDIANGRMEMAKKKLPTVVLEFMEENPNFINVIKEESETVYKYKQMWKDAPFPPTFMATDAVVIDSDDRLLLIERGGEMGVGSLALAGGFLEANLTHEENMKKELLEETNLDLDKHDHVITTSWFCDAPNRALRGRMTTMVFLVRLPLPFEYYGVKAGDDAAATHFIHVEDVDDFLLFSDHAGLIAKVLDQEKEGIPYVKNH